MTDREALLAAIHADPDDDTARLVYADWLQENGQFVGNAIRSAPSSIKQREASGNEPS